MKATPTRKPKNNEAPNKLCVRCRRSCKQSEFAVVSSCPRYYPLHKKQKVVKEWKQQDLFGDA
ncbi:MAG: hypothetical protein PHN92_02315 [Geobacter sp.]|nr:hypothetical protein [Geobacter sp.]